MRIVENKPMSKEFKLPEIENKIFIRLNPENEENEENKDVIHLERCVF